MFNTPHTPVVLSWSGGKDCAFALHQLRRLTPYRVTHLLSVLQAHDGTLNMHGISEALLDAQAAAIGLPLIKVWVQQPDNEHYEAQLAAALQPLAAIGIRHLAFGDLYLYDLRHYREALLQRCGWQALFPLWQQPTPVLAQRILAAGFRTLLCCVQVPPMLASHAGAEWNAELLSTLPAQVDPCGENGEFHTLCYDGPIFQRPLILTPAGTSSRQLQVHTLAPPQQYVYQHWQPGTCT
jgi:uncharacterized protein (TIGR00290 family)